MDSDDDVVVFISALEHFSYCPRQCALIHVDQTFEENLYTIRGALAHERVDSGDDSANRGVETMRSIPLWSDRYGLRGRADAVEWVDGVPYPVEYKSGRRKDQHPDVQLCAQALCLEEMLDVMVPRGAIYYVATRKRVEVVFDAVLRERTIGLIAAVRDMLVSRVLPAAVHDRRCPNCSLVDACLPKVVGEQCRVRRLQEALFVVE